jgi:PAS domain S-box-containing protein
MSINFATVFKYVPIAICISDEQTVKLCNPAASHLFGYTAETLIDMPIAMLWPSLVSHKWMPEKILGVIADSGCYTDVRTLKQANTDLFWCHISGTQYDECRDAMRYIWTFVKAEPTPQLVDALSPRERQIATALILGKTSKAIAQDVGLSIRTIEYYRERLMRRLGVANYKELICRLAIGTSR